MIKSLMTRTLRNRNVLTGAFQEVSTSSKAPSRNRIRAVIDKENSGKDDVKKVDKPKISKKAAKKTKTPLKNVEKIETNNINGDVRTILNGSQIEKRTGLHFPGCHVSAAGGLDNAIDNALLCNAKSFALFLRNQRSWNSKPLDPEVVKRFKEKCAKHEFPTHLILPHGSYLVNLGSPKEETRQKSVDTLIDELKRCSALGLNLFNIHPGSSCGEISREECIKLIADGINKALKETQGVKVVLENMSRQGNTIGGDLSELRKIMDLVEDKSRIGVCIDTCHAMAAGYDLNKQEGFDKLIDDIDKMIGFEWLVGLHMNDSKGEAGCKLDRHENIGKGKIGLQGFKRIMQCKHFTDLPMILETPYVDENGYKKEIETLSALTN
eukprot:TRINITY_DN7705_c0_g1_i13.p1 TRINITY_DN7705_c0_g1~~TRINITY_DN7705_c0_g1_i13.p1  ORF type:complete len:381 (+),score=63.52 TRINITY_DN7705_c0_g1_i13:31-1173(+)